MNVLAKLFVNYFINFRHRIKLCHLLTICNLSTLYMYLLYTPNNTTLMPVLSSAHILRQCTFPNSERLLPSGNSDLGGLKHSWVFSARTTRFLQMHTYEIIQ